MGGLPSSASKRRVSLRAGFRRYTKPCKPLCPGALDEDVVVIESTPAPAPPVPASEEINVTSTDSEVEIVTVGDGFRWATDGCSHTLRATSLHFDRVAKDAVSSLPSSHHRYSRFCIMQTWLCQCFLIVGVKSTGTGRIAGSVGSLGIWHLSNSRNKFPSWSLICLCIM